jgi:branched-chain amino acid transport system substrate-binding protein
MLVADSTECATNDDCASQGDFTICSSDRRCVSLLSEDCVKVRGDWRSPDAIYVGLFLKLTSQEDGGADLGANPDLRDAIELAFSELAVQVVGLPGGKNGAARPLVLVECDHTFDPIRAASYLTQTVRVPAIIGGYTSGVVIDVLQKVTVPQGVLFISPSATSAALSALPTNNLFWRTVPSDALQGRVHALLLPKVEQQIKAERGAAKIKVAMLDKGDAYGHGLRDVMTSTMTFNGETAAQNQTDGNLLVRDYPNTDDPSNAGFDFGPLVTEVTQFLPDVLVLFGTDEVARAFALVEQQWPAGVPRPYLLMSDGALVTPFFEAVDRFRGDGGADDPRRRIRGTSPANPSGATFTSYKLRFGAAYPTSDPYYTAPAYDAAYVIAYGIAAAQGESLTGASIAKGIHRLLPPGDPIDVGPENIGATLSKLGSGGNVDLNGASGNLDFNPVTGDVTDDIDVWCVGLDSSQTAVQVSSGLVYSATKDGFVGAFNAGNACGY